MKTVSGIVVSSKPISLSKATSTLSSFVTSDTGASQEFSVYLRRTLTSFKELKQLHKELKSPRSERKRSRRHRSEKENDDAETVGENPAQSAGVSEVSHGLEFKPKTQRQVVDAEGKKKERKKGEVRNFGEDGGGIAERGGDGGEKKEAPDSVEVPRNKKKKKRDNDGNSNENGGGIDKGDAGAKIAERANGGVERREPADSVDTQNKKKKRRDNVSNSGENRVQIKKGHGGAKTGSGEAKKEESKKRKSGVLEDGGSDASEEQGDKKKKKRRKS
ncbi:uncharacterized protein [Pyrus communis]|uniref:uncharacterized protein n=1 Tax=Pyrus communis TaxID=23211 RepID=UPI0035C0B140